MNHLADRLGFGLFFSVLVSLALSVPAGSQPFAYVSNYNSHSVSVVDTTSNAVTTTIPGITFADGVAPHPSGAKVYVTNDLQGTSAAPDRPNSPARRSRVLDRRDLKS